MSSSLFKNQTTSASSIASPPMKPWERNTPTSSTATTRSTSSIASEIPNGTSSNSNNPMANSSVSVTSNSSGASLDSNSLTSGAYNRNNALGNSYPTSGMGYGSGYGSTYGGGYGSIGGIGGYGAGSSFGGLGGYGGYGGYSRFGGYGGYGGGYGGYNSFGLGGSYGPGNGMLDPHGNMGWLASFNQIVGSVGQITEMLGMNAEALSFCVGSFVHFVERIGSMCASLAGMLSPRPVFPPGHPRHGEPPPTEEEERSRHRRIRIVQFMTSMLLLTFMYKGLKWMAAMKAKSRKTITNARYSMNRDLENIFQRTLQNP